MSLLLPLHFLAALLDSGTLEKAKNAYEKARFEDVVALLRDVDVGQLTPDQRADAHFMQGVSELALNNEALSQKAFIALYTDAPDFVTPPYTAKKVLAALARARRFVTIELDSEVTADTVRVCGRGLSQKADVKIVFALPEGEEGGPAIPDGECFRQALPISGRATGFYVVATVDSDVRATAGSRAQPVPITRKRALQNGAGAAAMPLIHHGTNTG